jgi:hypothetical protein
VTAVRRYYALALTRPKLFATFLLRWRKRLPRAARALGAFERLRTRNPLPFGLRALAGGEYLPSMNRIPFELPLSRA